MGQVGQLGQPHPEQSKQAQARCTRTVDWLSHLLTATTSTTPEDHSTVSASGTGSGIPSPFCFPLYRWLAGCVRSTEHSSLDWTALPCCKRVVGLKQSFLLRARPSDESIHAGSWQILAIAACSFTRPPCLHTSNVLLRTEEDANSPSSPTTLSCSRPCFARFL